MGASSAPLLDHLALCADHPRVIDPLAGFVFLLTDGTWRGEVARVIDIVVKDEQLRCVLETTAGPRLLPRQDVAVICHRETGVFHPEP